MKVCELSVLIQEELVRSGIDAAESAMMARLLLAHHLAVPLNQLPLHHHDEFAAAALEADLERLKNGEPLQYVTGETEFMGLTLSCTPSALIPRGDSEVVAERAIQLMQQQPAPRIADICTGCGAYALALAAHLPQAQLWAVDISPEALQLARRNAQQLQLEQRVVFCQGDLLTPLLEQGLRFDLLVSNPPYIPSSELPELPPQVRREPAIALDGGADGLYFYRRLAADSGQLLTPQGLLLIEHGEDQAAEIAAIMSGAGFQQLEVIEDYGHRQRGSLFSSSAAAYEISAS